MLLALAFAVQDIQLNAPATEAVKCAQATIATIQDDPNRGRVVAQTFYFLMRAAEADPGTKGAAFVDRTTEMAGVMAAAGKLDDPAALAKCDKAWPLARATAPVKLPAPGFERDMMCVSAASYLGGLLDGAKLTIADLDIKAIGEPYGQRLSDAELETHKIRTDDDMNAALGTALVATLRIGNLETIVRACGAAI